MSWMSENSLFPIEAIVHVDPDFFKLEMPEWKGNGKYKGYFERGQTSVDSLCGVEARYMANLAQEIALERGQNQGQKTIPNQGSRALIFSAFFPRHWGEVLLHAKNIFITRIEEEREFNGVHNIGMQARGVEQASKGDQAGKGHFC